MSYPHSLRETCADATIHIVGIGGAIAAGSVLVSHVSVTQDSTRILATNIYAALLIFGLVASAAYHMLPWDRTRNLLHRIDHAAIYLKIAGTYTPLVVLVGTGFAYFVLALVWIVALAGAVAKLSFWATDARWSLPLYLGLGWFSVLLLWPMWQTLPGATLALVGLGGLLYTAGTLFFSMNGLRYQMAIWHSFVLAASACLFAAVSLGVSA